LQKHFFEQLQTTESMEMVTFLHGCLQISVYWPLWIVRKKVFSKKTVGFGATVLDTTY